MKTKRLIVIFICALFSNFLFGQKFNEEPIQFGINLIKNKVNLTEFKKSIPENYTLKNETIDKDGCTTLILQEKSDLYELKVFGNKQNIITSTSFENPISFILGYFIEFETLGYEFKYFSGKIGVYERANSNIKIWCREDEKKVWAMIFKADK